MSTSTTILPLLNMSSHWRAAPSIDGTRRASSLPIRTALPWTCFEILSGVKFSRSAARASVTAASPRSMSNDRARAVSSAWMTAFIASVSWLSSRRPLSKTAPRNAAERADPATSPCRRSGTGGRAGRCRRGSRPRRTRTSACRGPSSRRRSRDVDLLDRVDEAEQVHPLLRVELSRRGPGPGTRSVATPGPPGCCRGAGRRGRTRRSGLA